MSTPVEQIKEKLEVVEFIKGYIELSQAGKNFKGLCPFHREKTPSFMVSPDRSSWHCFGCNLGGDIFSFLMRYENIEFAEALKILAEKAGVELQRVSPAEYRLFGLLYDLNEAAKEFYKKELEINPAAQAYLKKRGVKPETIAEFDIGFAPNSSEALNLHLLNSNHRPEDILRAGLAIKPERGGQFDRFRGRIMFPIWNNIGKIVGFTGRILPEFETEQTAKYVNSPETPIFQKSKVLYGFSKSKDAIREAKSAFLVEGQMDVIMSWQSGIKNVVASSGTALSPDHLRALKRLADNLVVSFDNDEAGWAAGERAIDLAENMDFNVKVVVFKDFKDAAEAAVSDPEKLKKLLENSVPAPRFYFEKYLSQVNSFEDREALNNLRAVIAKIKNIQSPVGQSFWLKELADKTGLSEKVLEAEAEKLNIKEVIPTPDASIEEKQVPAKENFSRRDIISQRFLSAIFEQGKFELAGGLLNYLKPEYQALFELLKKGETKSSDPKLDRLLDLILLRSETSTLGEIEALKENLFSEYLKERRLELTGIIRKAENEKNESALEEALIQLKELNSLEKKF